MKSGVRPLIPRVLSCVTTRMTIHLDLALPSGSSGLPEGWAGSPCRMWHPACLLLGLAPDEACHAVSVTKDPVVSYTAVSPLPDCSGGLFSAALALRSPWADVIRHRCPMEPGSSSAAKTRPRSSRGLKIPIIANRSASGKSTKRMAYYSAKSQVPHSVSTRLGTNDGVKAVGQESGRKVAD